MATPPTLRSLASRRRPSRTNKKPWMTAVVGDTDSSSAASSSIDTGNSSLDANHAADVRIWGSNNNNNSNLTTTRQKDDPPRKIELEKHFPTAIRPGSSYLGATTDVVPATQDISDTNDHQLPGEDRAPEPSADKDIEQDNVVETNEDLFFMTTSLQPTKGGRRQHFPQRGRSGTVVSAGTAAVCLVQPKGDIRYRPPQDIINSHAVGALYGGGQRKRQRQLQQLKEKSTMQQQ